MKKKEKNKAAQELGRISGKKFLAMDKETRSEYFRQLRLKRKDLQANQ